ncbi:hypothetical protein CGRA01v4_03720 [Colletotrichum graminicola]|uniref:Telomeric single stranded DNA binding POT1/Cdc13 domain-containing protein n=1 Tax=Colletotrichum graminicola (strain M1.001 / M2 / FGSC 10212) TaxID=645133 RepID=E3QFT6_COLGM|nr:uncharacterized protein GLRG_04915 [Colletotrichum graminicola M1.001]EFQ29771.1 hypothetical protein GLRG_04915 [Colletotrichum graminicola M1.001]WDK12441.1 hypothetical protein CGRA01v4_03720 [Colletotrichum graminicola]
MSGVQLPAQLEAAEGIPIAQLSPNIQDPKKRVARGVVTITWPYSIVKKTIAFLLAEPDYRLRRAKGQVRVEFDGPSAKAISEAALGSGDEITLSLDGVEFVVDDSKTRVPGTSLDWQLRFTERVLLQAKISDSDDVRVINVDHPVQPEPEPELELSQAALDPFTEKEKTPERITTPISHSSKRPIDQSVVADEYASPAFLKRARMSYGSLFDGGMDIFDEDVAARVRSKKRPKSSRYSEVWRYASQSPSPEPENPEEEKSEDTPMVEEQPAEQPAVATPSRPKMVDDGCQTIERDMSPLMDVQVAAEARENASYWQTPSKSTMVDSGVQSDLHHSPDVELPPGLSFGQHAPMPMFTSAHEQHTPAFEQPSLGPVFGHDLQGGMEPHYGAEGPFHEHPSAYPEAGLDHGLDTHSHYPASFLDGPNFGPHAALTSQPVPESIAAYQDHPQQHSLEGERHTVVIDAVIEPQQVPWGLTSTHYSRPPVRSGDAAAEGQEAGQRSETQAMSSDSWAEEREIPIKENPEDPEGEQAALKVEEDHASEDEDGPEQELPSGTHAERPYEHAENEAVAGEQEGSNSSGSSSSSSEDSEDEAEHDADDAGGDYDITNYRNLSNNQDDDDGIDLESDYGQEEDDKILEPELQDNEEDELEENVENYGEEYDEYDEEEEEDEEDEDEEDEDEEGEDEENQPPPTAPRGGAPEIISLLSDSEDEEEDEAPPSRHTPAQPRQMPQYDGSTDEMEKDDPSDTDESEAKSASNEDDQQISSDSSGEESEEEASREGTPTPMFRSMSSRSAFDAPELTSATLGDDLETMSPIKLPQATSLRRSSSRPSSRRDSDVLAADLEKGLEEDLAADDLQGDRKTPERTDIETNMGLDDRVTETESVPFAIIPADLNTEQQASLREDFAIQEESEAQDQEPQTQPHQPAVESRHTPTDGTDEGTKDSVNEESSIPADENSQVPVDSNQTLLSHPVTMETESEQIPVLPGSETSKNTESQVGDTLPSDHAVNKIDAQKSPEESVINFKEAHGVQTEKTYVDSDKGIHAVTDDQPTREVEMKVAEAVEVQTENTQSEKVVGQEVVEEPTSDMLEAEVTDSNVEISEVQLKEGEPLEDDRGITMEQESAIESEIDTGVTNFPDTPVEVDMESISGDSPSPADVDMADTEAMFVDETRDEDSDVDMDEMTEEQLIQTQLQEESMIFEDQTVTTITTLQTVEERSVSQDSETAGDANSASETEIIEISRVTVETSVTEPQAATDEGLPEAASEDVMDMDRPDDTISNEMAPSPAMEHGEVELVETRSPQSSEQLDMQDDDVQLPTLGGSQQAENISQSFVETQATETTEIPEANTQVTVPEVDGEAPSQIWVSMSEDERQLQAQKKPENQAAAPTDPAQSRQTIEPSLEASYEADVTSPTNDELSQIRDSSAQPSEAQPSLIAEDASEEVHAAQPSPRRARGHRRDGSDTTNKDQDPSVTLARASIASRRSTRLSDRTTPDSTRVTGARSQSLVLKSDSPDGEDDSVQLARSAIKSPSRASKMKEPKERDVAKSKQSKREATPKEAAEQTPAAVKVQLTRSLRVDVPDCISLKVLRNHPGKTVDVFAVTTTEPPEAKRAKGGPRGIMLAFNITDHSIAPAQTVAVQIFRPHKAALPVVHPGDVILLRNFSVMVLTGRGFGLRANDGSSWAVFEREGQDDLPQIRGPPVELTKGEASYAALLKQWYAGLDAKSLARLNKANEAAPAVGQ